ncbi:3-hydroxyacyl-CoA dehydrogenase NAD-binding domain-containing protein [Pararhodobacter sp. SW119]|uniref:3-hydroxyacyl-CoA dehydrogenase NAD-binding domain-containing protein n=1 Tax=Pararhodobacter sp. SW119 TaxID=2780075 RepID=UPI001ADF41BA|nr:3-hydroxyacyl-CoA dehydrogenase NAD-binding domain-containing protein [Pararhodobacter sp. SW119]
MTDNANPVRYAAEGKIAVICIDNPPVNACSQPVRAGLMDAMQRFADGPEKVAVIYGAGRTFVAGADIKEFGKPPMDPMLPHLVDTVEQQEKPVVCVLHGTALGGGLELALGAHYRVALRGTRVGLPEVTLGILPGAGGTQRLPRLIGLLPAAEIFTSARQVGAEEALELGIVDALSEEEPRVAGLNFAAEILARGDGPRRIRDLPGPKVDAEAVGDLRAKVARANRGQIAHLSALDVAVKGASLPLDEGLAEERKAFMKLMESPQRRALIHAFFAERKVARLPEIEGVEPRAIAHLGVIGGGTMGGGIAVAGLLNGLSVTLIERDTAAADKARDGIGRTLADSVKRGKLTEAKRAELLEKSLTTGDDYAALSEADVIIEAVFESMEVKREVFGKLDKVAKPGAILATNTSYLDVNEIAAATARPADVLGLHFFSPAHVMRLLEIVVADKTAPEVLATGFALARKLKKVPVRAGVCDGFIGNRMLRVYRLAADHMILAGASPYDIDRALVEFGFAMGPYAVADLAGLDIGYMTRQRLRPTKPAEERWGDWPDRLHEMGRLGRKSGRGYYIYDAENPRGRPDPEVEALIAEERTAKGITPRDFPDDEIVARYMAAMINEGARIVDEGIALRPLDVDVVKLFGYGFPRWRGGPMHHADAQGLDTVLATIHDCAKEDAYFWQPAPLLARLAAEGGSFASLNDD